MIRMAKGKSSEALSKYKNNNEVDRTTQWKTGVCGKSGSERRAGSHRGIPDLNKAHNERYNTLKL